jgi:hypothetical protein
MSDPPQKRKSKPADAPAKTSPSVASPGEPVPGWEVAAMSALTASRPFLPLAVLGAAALLAWLRGPGAGVLVVAGGALVFAISALWTSLRTLVGDAPVDLESAVAIGAATTEDEKKRRILQALKDLEIEHKLGKVSDDDFRALSGEYRAEAKRILRTLDEKLAPARERAEKLAAARMAQGPSPEEAAESAPAALACPQCATPNEVDAVFCKKCGHKLREAA